MSYNFEDIALIPLESCIKIIVVFSLCDYQCHLWVQILILTNYVDWLLLVHHAPIVPTYTELNTRGISWCIIVVYGLHWCSNLGFHLWHHTDISKLHLARKRKRKIFLLNNLYVNNINKVLHDKVEMFFEGKNIYQILRKKHCSLQQSSKKTCLNRRKKL